MLNFTVGPVQSAECVKKIGAEDCPYFRTQEFSDVMLESERLVKKFAGAPEGARAVFITGSGTASMEATVMNVLTPQDRVLVVNGGSFGHRFCELCEIHGVPHDEIKLNVDNAEGDNFDNELIEGEGNAKKVGTNRKSSSRQPCALQSFCVFSGKRNI